MEDIAKKWKLKEHEAIGHIVVEKCIMGAPCDLFQFDKDLRAETRANSSLNLIGC